MQPKTISILYWVFTILFAGLMIYSSYGSILVNEDAKKLIHDQLGYPVYFITFTGYAKLIGAIVILIPKLRTIKEWAYAGLFFRPGRPCIFRYCIGREYKPHNGFHVSMVCSRHPVLHFLEEKNEPGNAGKIFSAFFEG